MTHLPNTLYRAQDTQALDHALIHQFGIEGYALMSQAGLQLFRLINRRWPRTNQLFILVGPGNNGGDGYVLARLARASGVSVRLLQVGDVSRLKNEALQAHNEYVIQGGVVEAWQENPPDLNHNCVCVDALLGTGLDRLVSGVMQEAIEWINRQSVPVLAVDIPSGLNANTGAVMGTAVQADVTLSFIGLNQGLFTAAAVDHCGTIEFHDLLAPAAVYDLVSPSAWRLDRAQLAARLPKRAHSAHKGRCGHVVVVGGAPGYQGAAILCGTAALRTGAGLVTLLMPDAKDSQLIHAPVELMIRIGDTPERCHALLEQADVIVLGPGLAQSDWAQTLADRCFQVANQLVVDADGLTVLAQHRRHLPAQTALTPHPGEAARLLACDTNTLQADRFTALDDLVQQYQANVVLKGAGTLVGGLNQTPRLIDAGNNGMASAGMGDVLSGVIASLCGQGLSMQDAASTGALLHACAGDLAAGEFPKGLIASDLMPFLRQLSNCG